MYHGDRDAQRSPQGPQWPGAHVQAGAGQHEAQGGPSQELADSLLVAQLHALHLRGGGSGGDGGGNSSGASGRLPPSSAAPHFQQLTRRSASPGSSSHGGSNGSPHLHIDPSLLGGDLLAQLHTGATGSAGMGPLLHNGYSHTSVPNTAAAAAAMAVMQVQQQHAAQQQQQQQQQQGAPGRRRSGTGGGGGSGGAAGRRNEEKVRRTVYISDISDVVSEAQLAGSFTDCGQLVDCRVCGDPNSSMRFAFIEFMNEESAQQALSKSGAVLGDFPIRVSPSKTAIVPVNNTYLPRSTEERELVARTVFVGNIDRIVERDQLREFFDNLCGPVSKIRLLGDSQHNSKIAFLEFATAESARGALKLSGALLGTLPLRVSPSKTPVRIDSRRSHDAGQQQQQVQHAQHQQQQAQHQQHQRAFAAGMQIGSMPGMAGMVGMPAAMAASAGVGQTLGHSQLPPALLMAVAGLHMFPGAYQQG